MRKMICVCGILLVLAVPGARSQGSQSSAPPVAAGTTPQQNAQPAPPPERIRLGGEVEASKVAYFVPPVYPAIARAAHIQGTVVLHGIIATDGTVKELQYVSGPPLLMHAAMDAVKQWKYKPFLLDGHPVEVDTTIYVVFALGATGAQGIVAKKPDLATRIQALLPSNVPVAGASFGYGGLKDFEAAVVAARDLGIPFEQLKCAELGGQFCDPATGAKAMKLASAIRALKPEMSKDDVKNAEKKAKEEAKALF